MLAPRFHAGGEQIRRGNKPPSSSDPREAMRAAAGMASRAGFLQADGSTRAKWLVSVHHEDGHLHLHSR